MRRVVPTTSIAIVFHLVIAVMILTARAPMTDGARDTIAKTDDLVEVGSTDRAVAAARENGGEDTIVPAPGGGAMLVAPRGNVGAVMRNAPHVAAVEAPKEIAVLPSTEVPAVPTVSLMPPRAVGIGGSSILLQTSPTKTPAEAHASPTAPRFVTATIEDAARGATAANGRAVFVVKAETKEGDCSVVAVDLVDREGSGWDEARRVAYERLRGKKLTVPAGTKVALLSIEVTSGMSVGEEPGARRGENDMPELVLPELNNVEHRVIASRVVRTTYL